MATTLRHPESTHTLTAEPWTCGQCSTTHDALGALSIFCPTCASPSPSFKTTDAPSFLASIVTRSAFFSARLAALEVATKAPSADAKTAGTAATLISYPSRAFVDDLRKRKPRPDAYKALYVPMRSAHNDAKNLIKLASLDLTSVALPPPASDWKPSFGAAVRLRRRAAHLAVDAADDGFPPMLVLREVLDAPAAVTAAAEARRMARVNIVRGCFVRHETRVFCGSPLYEFCGKVKKLSAFLYFDATGGKGGEGANRWKVGRKDPQKHDAFIQCHRVLTPDEALSPDAASAALSPLSLRWETQQAGDKGWALDPTLEFVAFPLAREQTARVVSRSVDDDGCVDLELIAGCSEGPHFEGDGYATAIRALPHRVKVYKVPVASLTPAYTDLNPVAAAIRCGANDELVGVFAKESHRPGTTLTPGHSTPLHVAVSAGRSGAFISALCRALDQASALKGMLHHVDDISGRTPAALAVHLDSQRLPSFSYARQPRHDRSDAFEPYAPTLVAAARALERDAAARRLRRALSRASIARLSGEVSIGDEVEAKCIIARLGTKADAPLPLLSEDHEALSKWVPRVKECVRLAPSIAEMRAAAAAAEGNTGSMSGSSEGDAEDMLVLRGHDDSDGDAFEGLMGCYVAVDPYSPSLTPSNRRDREDDLRERSRRRSADTHDAPRVAASAEADALRAQNMALMLQNAPSGTQFWHFTGVYDDCDDVMLFYNVSKSAWSVNSLARHLHSGGGDDSCWIRSVSCTSNVSPCRVGWKYASSESTAMRHDAALHVDPLVFLFSPSSFAAISPGIENVAQHGPSSPALRRSPSTRIARPRSDGDDGGDEEASEVDEAPASALAVAAGGAAVASAGGDSGGGDSGGAAPMFEGISRANQLNESMVGTVVKILPLPERPSVRAEAWVRVASGLIIPRVPIAMVRPIDDGFTPLESILTLGLGPVLLATAIARLPTNSVPPLSDKQRQRALTACFTAVFDRCATPLAIEAADNTRAVTADGAASAVRHPAGAGSIAVPRAPAVLSRALSNSADDLSTPRSTPRSVAGSASNIHAADMLDARDLLAVLFQRMRRAPHPKRSVLAERLLLAAAAARDGALALRFSRILVEQEGARGVAPVAGDGRAARAVGQASGVPAVSSFFVRLGCFLGRYWFDESRPIHDSASCRVRFATDVNNGCSVAIKQMRYLPSFVQEIGARVSLRSSEHGAALVDSSGADTTEWDDSSLHTFVVRTIAWHARSAESASRTSVSTCGLGIDGQATLHETSAADEDALLSLPWRRPPDVDVSETEFGSDLFPFVLVLERGGQALIRSTTTHRIAGLNPTGVASLFGSLAAQVASLHRYGLVHCDVKLRNALHAPQPKGSKRAASLRARAKRRGSTVTSTIRDGVILCDLDSSLSINESAAEDHKLGSSAYAAPEITRYLIRCTERRRAKLQASQGSPAGTPSTDAEKPVLQTTSLPLIVARPSLDVWSLGVVLYELCTGRNLFAQDMSTDSLVEESDYLALALWLTIDENALLPVFPIDAAVHAKVLTTPEDHHRHARMRKDAMHLIAWCLQGDPRERPTMDQILSHPFIGGVAAASLGTADSAVPLVKNPVSVFRPTCAMTGNALEPVIPRDSRREKFHLFISHMQNEASGDVGTLFFLFEQMGMRGWRDMNQDDLTESGMRQGVYDSDVFVLFLTNSVLSRVYCIKEITWALQFGKPILIIIEREDRFFPFDLTRWREDRCTKNVLGKWEKGWLQMKYAECPPPVVRLIEERALTDVLPFRRREFEVDALAREVVHRASQNDSISWGDTLPPPAALSTASVHLARTIVYIGADSDVARQVERNLVATVARLAPVVRWSDDGVSDTVTHVIVLLSKGVLDQGSASIELLKDATRSGLDIAFLYIEPGPDVGPDGGSGDAWDFGEMYQLPESDVKAVIAGHEALKWRDADGALAYEHDALILEVLKRMRRFHTLG